MAILSGLDDIPLTTGSRFIKFWVYVLMTHHISKNGLLRVSDVNVNDLQDICRRVCVAADDRGFLAGSILMKYWGIE